MPNYLLSRTAEAAAPLVNNSDPATGSPLIALAVLLFLLLVAVLLVLVVRLRRTQGYANSLEESCLAREGELAAATAALASANRSLSETETALAVAKKDVSITKGQIRNMREQHARSLGATQQVLREFEQGRESDAAALAALKRDLASVEESYASLEQSYAAQGQQMEAAMTRRAEAEREAAQLREERNTAHGQIGDLSKAKQAAEAELAKAEADAKQERRRLQTAVADEQAKVSELGRLLDLAREEIREASQLTSEAIVAVKELEDAKAATMTADEERDEAREKAAEWEANASAAGKEVVALRNDLAEAEGRAKGARIVADRAKEQVVALQKDLDDAREALRLNTAELSAEVTRLEALLSAAGGDDDDVRAAKDGETAALRGAMAAEEDLRLLQQRYTDLESRLKEAEEQRDQARRMNERGVGHDGKGGGAVSLRLVTEQTGKRRTTEGYWATVDAGGKSERVFFSEHDLTQARGRAARIEGFKNEA